MRIANQPDTALIAKILAHATGATRVILFGSQARGDAHSASDWDFLLVMPAGAWMNSFDTELELIRTAQRAIWDAGIDISADLIPMSESAFKRGDNVLARIVWLEGRTLFQSGVAHA